MDPEQPEKKTNDHGEEVKEPRFGGPKEWQGDSDNRNNLANQEAAAGSTGTSDKASATEKDKLAKGFNPTDTFMPPQARLANLATWFFSNKKKSAAGIAATFVLALAIFAASFIKGFELAHLSQLMQKLHMKNGEDFADGRSERQILYMIGGEGERGRLGFVLTPFADAWEKKMIEDIGARPLYNAKTGRHVGYEIMDKKQFEKARQSNPKLQASYNKILENGARKRSGSDVLQEAVLRPTNRPGNIPPVSASSDVLDFQQTSGLGFKLTRQFNKAVGSSVVAPRIVGAAGARLQNKRAGIEYALFNNLKKKRDLRAAASIQKKQDVDYEKNVFKRWKDKVTFGSKKGTIKSGQTQKMLDDLDKATTEAESQGKSKIEIKAIRSAIIKASPAVAVFGMACAVDEVGDNAAAAQYQNYLMLMRVGATLGLAGGDQERAGQKLNVDEAGVMTNKLHSELSSWDQNNDLRREMDQEPIPGNQYETPATARLGNAGGKKPFFAAVTEAMNQPSGVGAAALGAFGIDTPFSTAADFCGHLDTLASFPPLAFISQQVENSINFVILGRVGTSTDELYGNLISYINGDPLDLENMDGAPLMGAINGGVVALSNDRYISMAGEGLDADESGRQHSAQLNSLQEERSAKLAFARYFDPNDYASLSGQLIDHTPSSVGQVASLINPIRSLGSLFSSLTPKAKAAELPDYGIKKYGYAERDKDDEMFENPFENARVFEEGAAGQQLLDEMNDKYGKCFGMKVHYDDLGVHLENGSAVNVFDLEDESNNDYKDCRDVRKLADNNPEKIKYKRYRFYMADAQIALSLACWEGDEKACREIGFSQSEVTAADPSTAAGVEIDMANLKKPSTDVSCASGTNDAGIIDGYTGGERVRIRLCEVSNLPQATGFGSKNGHATVNSRVSGAVYAMVEWAKKDGVNLSAISTSRTMANQQSLCPCDGVSVARAGYSNHQLGIAIDFGGGGVFMDKNNPMWKWLNDNADKFGYKPYEVEPWHWSPLGS